MKKNTSYRFFGYIIVIMLLLNTSETFAQWTFDIVGTVKQQETKKRLAGATITIKKNGSVWKTLTVPDNGKFELNLLPDAIYIIEFSKPGLVTKKIQVSSKDVPPEDAKYGLEFPLEMNLFKKIDGLDVSILDKPIAKIKYDADIGYPNYDEAYTKSIKSELDRLKKELAAKLKKQAEERKAKQAAYDDAIAAGNKAFNTKKWSEAQPFYTKASQIFADEDYPKNQLKLINDNIQKAATAEKEYNNTIVVADAAFSKKDLKNALTNYQKASQLKPTEKYPKEKIAAINALQATQNKLEADYKAAIASADGFLGNKTYDKAKLKYQAASGLKPSEAYPKNKIKEIDGILGELAKKDADYNNAIKQGDASMSSKDYKVAKEKYQAASDLKPSEVYPKNKIKEIDGILDELAKKDADYNNAIKQGDASMSSKDYKVAKEKYQAASGLKPSEAYPKNKIKEIDGILGELAKKDTDYNNTIKQGDASMSSKDYKVAKEKYQLAKSLKPSEKYPKDKLAEIASLLADKAKSDAEQKALDSKYKNIIAQADGFLGNKSYDDAKLKYQAASGLKPSEVYPKNKIKEIDGILGELAKKDTDYNNTIKQGDASMSSKDYKVAKEKYQLAKSLKPSEKYPKDKLAEIASLLADKAKSDAEQKALDSKYKNIIAQADGFLGNKSYDDAKLKYQAASGLKPSEVYPKNKIKEIDGILGELAKKDTDYNNTIKQGDASMSSKDYKVAKEKYQLAKSLKPSEKYPKDKLAEIASLLNNIAKSDAEQKALDSKYKNIIAQADGFLGNKSYDDAKLKYQAASDLKPSEAYPKNKIKEIDGILADATKKQQDKKLAQAADKKKREYFNAIIAQADGEFAAKNYNEAIKKYNEALGVIPNETYPQKKIKEINDVLAKLASEKQNSLLAKKSLDEKYNKLIAGGDAAFSTKDYATAKTKYKDALTVKSSETYPKNKLADIDKILAELAKQKDEKQVQNNALAQKKRRYDNFIKSADNNLLKKQYQTSIANYKSALGIMPNEDYPKNKIDEINKILVNIAKKDTDSKNALLAAKEKRKQYDNLIYKADRLLRVKKYENAKSKYNEALVMYANEQYPKNKIADIDALLQKAASTKKDIIVANTNLGARAKIDDTKEKEIEAKMAAMLNESNRKKDKKLQDEIAAVKKQEEIRVTTAIDKTNNAWKDVKAANRHLKQLHRNGNRFSIQNNDSLLAFAKDINETENNRVAKADKERLVTENQLAVIKKESLKYQENADKNYQQKIDSQHVFVNDISEQQLVLIENADKKRAGNTQQLIKLSDKMKAADKKNYERAKNQALDVKAYEKELNNKEQILITASLNRTAKNKKDIDNLVTTIEQSNIEAHKNYVKHDEDLAQQKEDFHQIEKQRVENADNARALNVKELAKVQEQIVANLNHQNKNYYEKLPKIKAYKKYLADQDKKFRDRAAVNRQKEREELAISKAKLGVETQSQKDRYKEFVKNLAEERRRNNDFQSDLVAMSAEKRILANADLSNFYTPKKRMINNLSSLPKTYPQGITEEVKESGNTIEIKRTKVTGNHADIYKRIFYKWGGTFYTKNGTNITQALWNKESIEK